MLGSECEKAAHDNDIDFFAGSRSGAAKRLQAPALISHGPSGFLVPACRKCVVAPSHLLVGRGANALWQVKNLAARPHNLHVAGALSAASLPEVLEFYRRAHVRARVSHAWYQCPIASAMVEEFLANGLA